MHTSAPVVPRLGASGHTDELGPNGGARSSSASMDVGGGGVDYGTLEASVVALGPPPPPSPQLLRTDEPSRSAAAQPLQRGNSGADDIMGTRTEDPDEGMPPPPPSPPDSPPPSPPLGNEPPQPQLLQQQQQTYCGTPPGPPSFPSSVDAPPVGTVYPKYHYGHNAPNPVGMKHSASWDNSDGNTMQSMDSAAAITKSPKHTHTQTQTHTGTQPVMPPPLLSLPPRLKRHPTSTPTPTVTLTNSSSTSPIPTAHLSSQWYHHSKHLHHQSPTSVSPSTISTASTRSLQSMSNISPPYRSSHSSISSSGSINASPVGSIAGFKVLAEGAVSTDDVAETATATLIGERIWNEGGADSDEEASAKKNDRKRLIDGSSASISATGSVLAHAEGGKYNGIVAYALLLNCMMGVGMFGLPHAFWHAGAPLAILMGIFLFIVNVLTCMWVLEVMARTHGVMQTKAHNTLIPKNTIGYEKYDLGKMSHIFGGMTGRLACQVVVITYCFGCMWACAAVFGSSVSQLIFELLGGDTCDVYFKPSRSCTAAYLISILIYGVVVTVLTLLDYGYQLVLQLFLSVYRFLGFLLMIGTIIYALAVSGPLNLESTSGSSDSGPSDIWTAHWDGFYLVFTGMAYVFVVQYNMPEILTPVKSKKKLKGIMIFNLLTVAIVTVGVGILCAWFFNGTIEPLCILNWRFFTGLGPSGWSEGERTWFAWFTYIVILLFPVVDLISIFPLVAVTLSDNLTHSLPSSLVEIYPVKTKVISRIVAVIPPLIGAMVEANLSYIFMFSGLPAFVIQCVIPAALQLLSFKYFESVYAGKDKTPYTTAVFSSRPVVVIIVIVGILALLVSALCSLVPLFL
ncbi:Transmembrane protein [Pelomyxa schiedti]|nr:Transmembrane protein [Pelomyxa schiedti]